MDSNAMETAQNYKNKLHFKTETNNDVFKMTKLRNIKY